MTLFPGPLQKQPQPARSQGGRSRARERAALQASEQGRWAAALTGQPTQPLCGQCPPPTLRARDSTGRSALPGDPRVSPSADWRKALEPWPGGRSGCGADHRLRPPSLELGSSPGPGRGRGTALQWL